MGEPVLPPAAPPLPARSGRPRRSRRRWWLAAAALPLALLALLLLGLCLLIYQPASLPWLFTQVPGLQAEGVQGTVADGDLRIAKLSLQLPNDGGRLQLEQLAMQRHAYQFRPKPGIWLDLHFEALRIARLQWTSGKASGRAPALPTSLRLPLSLRIDQLSVAELRVDQQPPIKDLQAALAIGADDGARHLIDKLSLVFEQNRLQGRLALTADAPLALDAKIDAVRSLAPAWTASVALAGPLDKLALEAQLKGSALAGSKAPALSAQASLQPLAKWPLQALSLSTRGLDLSSLSSQLPLTALAGRVTLQSSGLDQPAQVQAELVNQQPGAWDSGRLPLRSITLVASGEPRHTDRLVLERFSLQLADQRGDAGRISGKGRWQGEGAELTLQLDALQPLRLDSRAPPIDVSGPLSLRASGLQAVAPQLDFSAKLAGRALDGSGLPVQLQLAGEASAKHLLLRQFEASAGKARASAELDARTDTSGWRLKGNTTLDRFDPLPWWAGPPGSAWRRGPHRLNGQLALDLQIRNSAADAIGGSLEQALRAFVGQATLRLTDSQLAGMPLAGELALRSGDARYNVDGLFKLAGGQLGLQGRIGLNAAADSLALTLDTPSLAALTPLGRLLADASPGLMAHWPSAGSVKAELQLDGRWPALRSQGKLDLAKLASPDATLQQATLNWRAGTANDDALSLQLDARGLVQGMQRLDLLQAKIDGSLREHRLDIQLESPVRPPAWAESLLGPTGTGTRLAAAAIGRWQAEPANGRTVADAKGGRWLVQKFDLQGGARGLKSPSAAAVPGAGPAATAKAPASDSGPWLRAGTPELELRLDATLAPTLLRMAPGRLQLLSTALAWREAQWQADGSSAGQLTLLAQLETIDVAKLLAKLQPNTGWAGDLTLGGRIEVRSGARFDADVVLERLGGDLSLPDDLDEKKRLKLGLSELRLALSAHDGVWQFAQGLAGSSFGQMAGAQVLRSSADRRFPPPEAPLSGVIEAQVANIGTWGNWLPPGWRLAGMLRTGASFSGTLGAPQVLGEMRGEGLALRNVLLGVNLSDGDLAITLTGDRANIERFSFKGGDGSLSLAGDATLGEAPTAKLQLKANKFRLLGRIDRRLIASGQADLVLGADSLKLDGDLRIDEGLIDISRSAAPSLDDDVRVHSSGTAQAGAATPSTAPAALRKSEVAVRIDLGEQLQLKGRGISTGLRGKLVASMPGGRFAMHGSIRTDGGQFAAYGQKLEIRRGEFEFNGAPDTARIDVLAVRPNLEVLVGVSVSGAALAPRVRLYSEPSMADYDKLSWLMLGRAPDGLGRTDTALLHRAAMAALSGDGEGATDKVVNAIGLTDFGVSQTDGDSRDTVITLGKQLSERWYVGYERSVNTATGTWQLIYRVASRFTLRAQSGSDNALDAIWSWRW